MVYWVYESVDDNLALENARIVNITAAKGRCAMEMNHLCDSLRAKGYHVFCAQSGQQAADYIGAQIHQKTVGFGDSQTLASLDLPRRLAVDKMDDMEMEVVLIDEDLGL